METAVFFFIVCVCISMFMLLARAVKGPTIFDRILAANLFGTNVVILIVMIAYSFETASFIDMALVYAFLNFVATIALLRFFRYGKFSNENKAEGE
jgi:multicomponent Na+:H+ antiporter subunit F